MLSRARPDVLLYLDPVRIVECANHDRATVWSVLGGGHDGCSASIAEVQPIPPIAFINTNVRML